MEHTRYYSFEYNPNVLWKFLTKKEQVGLNRIATRLRFERLVNQKLACAYPVYDAVHFTKNFRYTGVGNYRLTGRKDTVVDTSDFRFVNDLWINKEWLTYISPEAHVKALRNCLRQEVVNHAICLPSFLVTNYLHEPILYKSTMTAKELLALGEKAKDETVWSKTRFVLG